MEIAQHYIHSLVRPCAFHLQAKIIVQLKSNGCSRLDWQKRRKTLVNCTIRQIFKPEYEKSVIEIG